jgi:hypothetical protein
MPRKSIATVADQRLAEADHPGNQCVDLQVDIVDEDTDELIARWGGRWDRRAKRYVGDAPKARVVRVFGEQKAAVRAFDRWLAELTSGERDDEDWLGEIVMAGGQRSGKTALLITKAIGLAVAVPDAIVWIVTPSEGFYSEPIAYLEQLMPRDWYVSLGWPHWCYTLPNGSTIVMRTAHRAGRLKQGKATAVFINEAQQVSEEGYATLLGRVFDDGGIVVSAANPPDVGDKGTWLTDYASACKRGGRDHAAFYHFHPEKNPHVDQRRILAAKSRMDPRTYAIQIGGEFRGLPDQVLYTWDPTFNERSVPQLGDITGQLTRRSVGRPYKRVIGVDVQMYPWIVGVEFRFFANADDPGNHEAAISWICGEYFIDQGDELVAGAMMVKQLAKQGVKPEETLIVIDASCFHQQAIRDEDKQRPEFKTKGSAHMFMSLGFRVVEPDKHYKRNPDVRDRCRSAASRICTEDEQRLVFADPELAPRTCESTPKWRYNKSTGMPSRSSKHAHGGDALTYVLWRFFPRRRKAGKVEITTVSTLQGRNRTKGY